MERHKKPRPALDPEALERLALVYVGRYATTRAKMRSYLERKLLERGWNGSVPPAVPELTERLVRLGYIDDGAFASARAASLRRRGFGEYRLGQALRAAGIEEPDAASAKQAARHSALATALRFAKRRRIGPYSVGGADTEARRKAFASMMRAGHPLEIVRRVLDLSEAEIPELDGD